MAKFLCNICKNKVTIRNVLDPCPECGSQGSTSQYSKLSDGVDKFTISAGSGSYIVYEDKTELTRTIVQRFFPLLTDDSGNNVYKYFEIDKPMLLFTKNKDDVFIVSAPVSTTNYFLLNGTKIEAGEQLVKAGDILDLFSSKHGKTVSSFLIT
jgi:hypothetical protein